MTKIGDRWLRWNEVCLALRIAGFMKDFSQAECRRVTKLLRNKVADGTAKHKKEGHRSYWTLA